MKILRISLVILLIGCTCNLRGQKTETQLLQYLQSFRGGSSPYIYPCSFIPGVNVTNTVKKRILALLKNEWTTEELKPIVDANFKKEFDYMYFEDIVIKANDNSKIIFFNSFPIMLSNSKRDTVATVSNQYHLVYDSVFKTIYDSIGLIYRKRIEKKIKEAPVSNELVKLVANIGLKEAMPLLKNDLASTSKHLYKAEIAELALAKLGDKKMYEKILKECSYNSNLIDYDNVTYQDNKAWLNDFYYKFDKLTFLNTQESLFQLHNWLDTSKFCIDGQVNANIYLGYSSFIVAYRLLQFFRRGDEILKFRNKDGLGINKITADAIMDVKKWMIENKGKYVVKHECPD